MHARRALLLFALVLGLTAVAAAVSPSQESSAPAESTAPSPVEPARMVAFEVGPRAVARTVRVGERVIVTVQSGDGGYVRIPRLGRSAYATPAAPVRFSLLAPAAGRYDVTFEETSSAEPTRIGTLVTRP